MAVIEVLAKARIVPKRDEGGVVRFVGEGKRTADVQQVTQTSTVQSTRFGLS